MPGLFKRLSFAGRSKDKTGDEKNGKRKPTRVDSAMDNGLASSETGPSVNGHANGDANQIHGDATKFDKGAAGAVAGYPDPPDLGHGREQIAKALTSLGNLVSHSMRPLPEKYGDGSYAEHEPHASLFQELSSIGVGGARRYTHSACSTITPYMRQRTADQCILRLEDSSGAAHGRQGPCG